jgi:two-component system, LytTR family, response regulator
VTAAPAIRVVVAEDVPAQRKLLVGMLAREPHIEVVAEAANGAEAVDAITTHRPDLLFLDVQMPELDAFQVIETIGVDRLPLTIFVTAYDAYALRAFEVHAVDYLLKPFDEERLSRAVDHATTLIQQSLIGGGRAAASADLAAILAHLQQRHDASPSTSPRLNPPLSVRVGEGFVFLEESQIDWIEASGKSSVLHVGTRVVTTRESIGAIGRRVNPGQFVQVHRSAIVNVARIQAMQPWFKGAYVIILRDGTRITTGRAFRDAVRQLIAR